MSLHSDARPMAAVQTSVSWSRASWAVSGTSIGVRARAEAAVRAPETASDCGCAAPSYASDCAHGHALPLLRAGSDGRVRRVRGTQQTAAEKTWAIRPPSRTRPWAQTEPSTWATWHARDCPPARAPAPAPEDARAAAFARAQTAVAVGASAECGV